MAALPVGYRKYATTVPPICLSAPACSYWTAAHSSKPPHTKGRAAANETWSRALFLGHSCIRIPSVHSHISTSTHWDASHFHILQKTCREWMPGAWISCTRPSLQVVVSTFLPCIGREGLFQQAPLLLIFLALARAVTKVHQVSTSVPQFLQFTPQLKVGKASSSCSTCFNISGAGTT